MSKTMAEVVEALAKRNYEADWDKGWDKCPDYARSSWIESAQETIDFLSAAGFGLVADAKAEAALETTEDILTGMTAVCPDEFHAIGFVEGYRDACVDTIARATP